MAKFTPCQGKTACRDDGKCCLICGRSLDEITWLRDLLGQITDIAITYDYNNVDEYTTYIKAKLDKMINYRHAEIKNARTDHVI